MGYTLIGNGGTSVVPGETGPDSWIPQCVECIQVQGVLVAKESGFDQQKFGRVDQGKAAFPLRKANRLDEAETAMPVFRLQCAANKETSAHRGDLRLASHKDAGGDTGGILGRHRGHTPICQFKVYLME
jgi:hypothetical protein